MNSIDYYTGFEGEPEVIFTRRGNQGEILEQINLWEGYFSDMIDAIPLGVQGVWEGISVHYHLLTGWSESSPWEYVDFDLFLTQLEKLDTTKFKFGTMPVYETILSLVQNCKRLSHRLFIEQD